MKKLVTLLLALAMLASLWSFACAEEENGQRHKNNQRNIVGDKHGCDENTENQKKGKHELKMKFSGKTDDGTEDIFLLKALQNAEHHKKGAQRMPVDTRQEIRFRRRDKKRDNRHRNGDGKHGLLF